MRRCPGEARQAEDALAGLDVVAVYADGLDGAGEVPAGGEGQLDDPACGYVAAERALNDLPAHGCRYSFVVVVAVVMSLTR